MKNPSDLRRLTCFFCVITATIAILGCKPSHANRAQIEIEIVTKKEVAGLEAEIALARNKGDINALFISLKKALALQPAREDLKAELAPIETAQRLLQKLNVAQSAHDRALTIRTANDILDIFPHNLEAVEAQAKANAEAEQDRRRVSDLRTKFEISLANYDLAAAQLALRTLADTSQLSSDEAKELERVKAATALVTNLRAAQGDRNHEEAVLAASKLLDLYPEMPEARRAFRESGLLFLYLESAIHHATACFTIDEKTKDPAWIRITTGEDTGKWDVDALTENLKRATDFLHKASTRDPFFIQSLALEESIKNMKTSLGWAIAEEAFVFYVNHGSNAEKLANRAIGAMEATLDKNKYVTRASEMRSGWDTWRRDYAAEASRLFAGFKAGNPKILRGISALAALTTDENQLVIQQVQDLTKQFPSFISGALGPAGTVKEYRDRYTDLHERCLRSTEQFNGARPTFLKIYMRALDSFGAWRSGKMLYKNPDETPKAIERHKHFLEQA